MAKNVWQHEVRLRDLRLNSCIDMPKSVLLFVVIRIIAIYTHIFNMTEDFEYLPLPSEHIRFLFLEESSDKNAPLKAYLIPGHMDDIECNYEALSYAWGKQSPTSEILCENEANKVGRIPITKHLHSALVRFRTQNDPCVLWCDAICINQSDSAEKSVQIPLMRRIYQNAFRVLVWLGSEGGSELSRILRLSRLAETDLTENGRRARREAILTILESPYFSRRWIIQELASNVDIQLFAGSEEISWLRLHTAIQNCPATAGEDPRYPSVQTLNKIYHLWQIWSGTARFGGKPVAGIADMDLITLLNTFHKCDCSEDKDQIYAIAGLAQDVSVVSDALTDSLRTTNEKHIIVDVNYSLDTKVVFTNVARSIFETGSAFDLLAAACDRKYDETIVNVPNLKLPSWVPDWRLEREDSLGLFTQRREMRDHFKAQTIDDKSSDPRRIRCSIKVAHLDTIRSTIFFDCRAAVYDQGPDGDPFPTRNIYGEDYDYFGRLFSMWRDATGCAKIVNEKDVASWPSDPLVSLLGLHSDIDDLEALFCFTACRKESEMFRKGPRFTRKDELEYHLAELLLRDFHPYRAFASYSYSARPVRDDTKHTYFGLTMAEVDEGDRIIILPPTSNSTARFSALVQRPRYNGRYELVGGAIVLLYSCNCAQRDGKAATFKEGLSCGFSVASEVAWRKSQALTTLTVDLE